MKIGTRAVAAVLTALLSVGVVAGTASPAGAQSSTTNDKKGDQEGKLDIRKVKISYTKKSVTIKITGKNFQKKNIGYVGATVLTRTGTFMGRFNVSWEPKAKKASVTTWSIDIGGSDVLCKIPVKKKLKSSGSITFTVPNTCIDSPDRVKLSTVSISKEAKNGTLLGQDNVTGKDKWLKQG